MVACWKRIDGNQKTSQNVGEILEDSDLSDLSHTHTHTHTRTHAHTPCILGAATVLLLAWQIIVCQSVQMADSAPLCVILLLSAKREWRAGRHPKPLGKGPFIWKIIDRCWQEICDRWWWVSVNPDLCKFMLVSGVLVSRVLNKILSGLAGDLKIP